MKVLDPRVNAGQGGFQGGSGIQGCGELLVSRLHPGVQNFWVCGLLRCPQTVIDLRKGRPSFPEMTHNDGVKKKPLVTARAGHFLQ